ncbi:MAG: DUF4153 domain-containing protein [Pseudomonadota bacterium]
MNFPSISIKNVAALRVVIGLAQGAVLYGLYPREGGTSGSAQSALTQALPAAAGNPALLDALATVTAYVPLIAVVGIGNLRWRPLLLWLVASALLCGWVGYDADASRRGGEMLPYGLWASAAVPMLLFIANALVVGGALDRRPIATFRTYFDVAWKQATQAAIVLVFVGLFWSVLWLGAMLFRAIRIEFVADLLVQGWFWIPATTGAVAASLHLTDAQTVLMRAVRTLLLNTLAWLLPLLVLIGSGFLVALPFTGLAPLWATGAGTAGLLSASAALILLINSHYQDGGARGERVRLLVVARFVGALLLGPLVALAAMGLGLRIDQHGLTPVRVLALAVLAVLACHAAGYALAAIRSGLVLRGLPATNIVSALVAVALMLAMLTPTADPARMSVASQVARLESGRIAADAFDYDFLRRRSGRYGKRAFEHLRQNPGGPNAAQIVAAIARLPEEGSVRPSPATATAASRRVGIKVLYPEGASLPDDFLATDWNAPQASGWRPLCLKRAGVACEAFMLDLTGSDEAEVVIWDSASATVFSKDAAGRWSGVGSLENVRCRGVTDAIGAGRLEVVPSRHREVLVGDARLTFRPDCPRP